MHENDDVMLTQALLLTLNFDAVVWLLCVQIYFANALDRFRGFYQR
jgi:hypothetical protein